MKEKGYFIAFVAMLAVLIIGLILTVHLVDFYQFDFRLAPHYQLGFYLVLISTPFLFYFAFGYASLNRPALAKDMPTDPAKLGFWEGYISQIGKTGKTLRYWMKCVLLGLILWATVGVSSVLSDTLAEKQPIVTKGFILDYYFLTLSLVTGVTSLFAIRALRGLGDKLEETSKRLESNLSEKPKETRSVVSLVEEEKEKKSTWLGQSKRFWYWIASFFFASIGLIVGILTSRRNPSHWYGSGHVISSIPFIICCAFIGFTVGTLIFISARGIAILKRYCRECVIPEDLCLSIKYRLNSKEVNVPCDLSLDRLRKVGHFIFELNFAAAIPSFAFFASYLSGTQVDGPTSLICLTVYTIILICISIPPLVPFHIKMAVAKENALEIINKQFRAIYPKHAHQRSGDSELVGKLNDLYDFHEKIDKMPAWPLDRWIDSKLLVTIPLPVVLGVLSTFISKWLGM